MSIHQKQEINMGCNTDLEITRKRDVSFTLTFTRNGAILDISDCKIVFTIMATLTEGTPLLQVSKVVGASPAGATGIYIFALTNAETAVAAGTYYYEFTLIEPASTDVATQIGSGRITVEQNLGTVVTTP